MQPDHETTNHPPRPQSLAAMGALGWFAVVPELMAAESRRVGARRAGQSDHRPERRENEFGTLWRGLCGFARRLLSAPGLSWEGYTIARKSSGHCKPQDNATFVSLVIDGKEKSGPAPKNPQATRDKSVSRPGLLLLQRAPRRPPSVSGASKSNPAAKGRFGHRQQGRNFTDREE